MHELRHALRTLARSPGITLVAVATLALGLGAALGIGAYASALLRPPVDAPHPERIVRLDGDAVQQASQPFSYPDLQQYRRHSRTVPEIAANALFGAVIELGDQVRFGWAQTVTGNYFALFDARPSLGRLLQPEDESEGATPVAVLGHFFWRHRLGADRDVVGREIEINGQPFTVVGVAREGFVGAGLPAALYVPATFWDEVTARPGQEEDRDVAWLWPVGTPGSTGPLACRSPVPRCCCCWRPPTWRIWSLRKPARRGASSASRPRWAPGADGWPAGGCSKGCCWWPPSLRRSRRCGWIWPAPYARMPPPARRAPAAGASAAAWWCSRWRWRSCC